MICSAEGWVAVYGTDPEEQTTRRVACWAADPTVSPLVKYGVEGLVVDDTGRLALAQDQPGFARYEYDPR